MEVKEGPLELGNEEANDVVPGAGRRWGKGKEKGGACSQESLYKSTLRIIIAPV